MTAEEAMEPGLAGRMVEKEELMETALELASAMNRENPMGLRLTEEAINMSLDAGGLEQVLNMEDRNQSLLVARGLSGRSEKTSRYFNELKSLYVF